MMQRKDNVPQQCIPCGEGEKAVNKFISKLASCKDCPAGRYQKETRHTRETCEICAVGRYQREEGKSECIACGTGMTTRTGVVLCLCASSFSFLPNRNAHALAILSLLEGSAGMVYLVAGQLAKQI